MLKLFTKSSFHEVKKASNDKSGTDKKKADSNFMCISKMFRPVGNFLGPKKVNADSTQKKEQKSQAPRAWMSDSKNGSLQDVRSGLCVFLPLLCVCKPKLVKRKNARSLATSRERTTILKTSKTNPKIQAGNHIGSARREPL